MKFLLCFVAFLAVAQTAFGEEKIATKRLARATDFLNLFGPNSDSAPAPTNAPFDIGGLINGAISKFLGFLSTIFKFITGLISAIVNGAKFLFGSGNALQGIAGPLTGLADGVTQALTGPATGALADVGNLVGNVGKELGNIFPAITAPLTGLANGLNGVTNTTGPNPTASPQASAGDVVGNLISSASKILNGLGLGNFLGT